MSCLPSSMHSSVFLVGTSYPALQSRRAPPPHPPLPSPPLQLLRRGHGAGVLPPVVARSLCARCWLVLPRPRGLDALRLPPHVLHPPWISLRIHRPLHLRHLLRLPTPPVLLIRRRRPRWGHRQGAHGARCGSPLLGRGRLPPRGRRGQRHLPRVVQHPPESILLLGRIWGGRICVPVTAWRQPQPAAAVCVCARQRVREQQERVGERAGERQRECMAADACGRPRAAGADAGRRGGAQSAAPGGAGGWQGGMGIKLSQPRCKETLKGTLKGGGQSAAPGGASVLQEGTVIKSEQSRYEERKRKGTLIVYTRSKCLAVVLVRE